MRAMQKLERKRCVLIVVNGAAAIHALSTQVEIIDRAGSVVASLNGTKGEVARGVLGVIGERLIAPQRSTPA